MSELAKDYADSIADTIEENNASRVYFGTNPDTGDDLSAYDYLEDILDIQYIVSSKREYLGARLLLTYGGPNTWLDTKAQTLSVYWGSDSAVRYLPAPFCNELDNALEEIWNMN